MSEYTLAEILRTYQQADEEGIMVLISRQACDEAADEIVRLTTELEKVKAENERFREALHTLLELKRLKDQNGKTDFYKENQPKAWAKAWEVMYSHGIDEPEF